MGAEHEMARATLDAARRTFLDNVRDISLEEALDAAGGLRSVIGLIKHATAWTAVYRSYAFDPEPRHWKETDWPRGLRERIDPTQAYLAELIAWFDAESMAWIDAITDDLDLAEVRPLHWGDRWPLREIAAHVAAHCSYHAGEINLILSVRRGEAWEYGEHVEENHIVTLGHSVRMPWMSDEGVERIEAEMRAAAGPPSGQ
jgi:uncharacterized damage-inducible protein DinB